MLLLVCMILSVAWLLTECRFSVADDILVLTYAVISFLRSLARYWSPGLSPASGFEHPASTLPTRFPAALGIGHG